MEHEMHPIETAPDGEVLLVYRPSAQFGLLDTLVFAIKVNGRWYWPDAPYDPYNAEEMHGMIEAGDYYHCADFTHWLPLPKEPKP